jgi:hypothetical protein
MTIDESLPPKPNELQMTLSNTTSFCPSEGRMVFSPELFQPRLAGIKLCCIAKIDITLSIEPDADVVCPVNDLVLETAGISLPKRRMIAWLSEASLLGVPVP